MAVQFVDYFGDDTPKSESYATRLERMSIAMERLNRTLEAILYHVEDLERMTAANATTLNEIHAKVYGRELPPVGGAARG